MGNEGWIKTYRKIQDCWIWNDKEPFDKRSAWMDLLLTANHAEKKILLNGELITVRKGQVLTSTRKLSAKWKWSVNKVYRFINLLESDNMVTKESDNNRTLLTIANYEVYQSNEYTNENSIENTNGNTNGNTDGYSDDTPMDTVAIHQRNTNKNVKNDKEYKECKESNLIVSNDTICQTETVRRVVEEWNTLEAYGIKPIKTMKSGTQRYDWIKARIKEYGLENVLKAIGNIRNSDFLQGKHKGSPWQITFDWFARPNNFPKVLDGQYESEKQQKNDEWEDFLNG